MIRIPFFGASDDASAAQPDQPVPEQKAQAKPAVEHPLDACTGGVFSAATSGERAAKVRAWLATEPDLAVMQEVYKALSMRDKGAARALREKLDEHKRSKAQEALAVEWAAKAEALLQASRFNIADAMAWQRDAAKAGAPLGREPLLSLKNRLAGNIRDIEDLQMRAQVQREAAVLLAQRIELLSARSWHEADGAQSGLQADVQHWHEQTQALQQEAYWAQVDARYAGQLDSARQQLDLVAQAFDEALTQARAAATDKSLPLPPVQIWADELRAARGDDGAGMPEGAQDAASDAGTQPPSADELAATTARQTEAQEAVEPLLQVLEKELLGGHSKAAATAAQALRNAMKEQARFLPATLETQVQAALAKAGELEGWQRWRADQLRTELVQKAEALIHRQSSEPAEVPAAASEVSTATPEPEAQAQDAADATADEAGTPPVSETPAPDVAQKAESEKDLPALPTSPHSPRKLQAMLRQLREQWKEIDQGGIPNHALWRRFDQACNEAHRIVQAWLAQMKQHAAEQKAMRLALLAEVQAWGESLAQRAQQTQDSVDWKVVYRELTDFGRRWREAGHVSEKVFAELRQQWKAVVQQAARPLEAAQQASIATRQQLIEQAQALADGPLRIDAIKELQQHWQQEAQRIPLERRQEQKLWEAFRKPIDAAFQRRGQQREHAAAALSQRDQAVLDAVRVLDAAVAKGDAQAIRSAMQAVEAATRAQQAPAASVTETAMSESTGDAAQEMPAAPEAEVEEPVQEESLGATPDVDSPQEAPASRPVVAMRGDDRPGARAAAATAPERRAARPERGGRRASRDAGGEARREGGRFAREDTRSQTSRAPRLSDTAFRAQRNAVERAQGALRKLAAQAHGETLVQVLAAWEQRTPDALPPVGALGKSLSPAQRALWVAALSGSADAVQRLPADEALLRLEMAAEVPTPAEHLKARRALQLQLLTRRNDPSPAETWAEDVSHVLATSYDAAQARRLQNVLRALMRR